jgi:hypothetical protein
MTGLLAIGLLVAWFLVVVWLVARIVNRFKRPLARSLAGVISLPLLFVAPVADELIGRWQFKSLCEENAVYRKHVPDLAGRTTRFSAQPSNELVAGTAIPILHSRVMFTDVRTNTLVLEFDRYTAMGGFLVRSLGVANRPLLIDRATCTPDVIGSSGEAANSRFNFVVIN